MHLTAPPRVGIYTVIVRHFPRITSVYYRSWEPDRIAEQKRRFAEGNLQVAQQHRKISKVLQQVTEVVETLPAAAPIHRPSWRHFCSGRR